MTSEETNNTIKKSLIKFNILKNVYLDDICQKKLYEMKIH
jgi:hypothetical protein